MPQVGRRWFLSYRQAKRECDRGFATVWWPFPKRSRPRDRDRRGPSKPLAQCREGGGAAGAARRRLGPRHPQAGRPASAKEV